MNFNPVWGMYVDLKRTVLLVFLVSLLSLSLPAQSADFFPLESVKPGMKAVGKTVFEGTNVEEFDVEIMGVLENTGPQQNMILARLSGEKIDRTGVFAGMSGSPVYIDGKLVGAVAFAFSFATEPICGITPIGEMVEIFKEHIGTSFSVAKKGVNPSVLYQVTSWPQLNFPHFDRSFDLEGQASVPSQFGNLEPIQTPLNVSGVSRRALADFAPQLQGLGMTPVFGSGVAKANDFWEDVPLEPGSTINVQLIRGDLDVSASGTVTHISGEKVYAFGHPFLGVGYTELPLAKAGVIGVIPTLMNSQKISATMAPIGKIVQDRSTGILGVTEGSPQMVPVNLTLSTSRSETRKYNYELVSDRFLTPFLLTFAVHSSIVSSERSVGGQTLQLKCRISLEGQPEISFENNISDLASSPARAALTAASPVNFILNSGFDDIVLEEVAIEIEAVEETKEATLEKVWQDKLEVEAGEEVGITIFLRKQNGEIRSEKYPIKIPEGVSPGDLKIMIGDGLSVARLDAEVEPNEFVPENLGQLVRAINNLKKNDRLYIRLYRDQPGAIVGGQGLPGLPPSILALYDSQKTSGDTQSIKRVVFMEHELPATEFALSGQKIIQVKVKG